MCKCIHRIYFTGFPHVVAATRPLEQNGGQISESISFAKWLLGLLSHSLMALVQDNTCAGADELTVPADKDANAPIGYTRHMPFRLFNSRIGLPSRIQSGKGPIDSKIDNSVAPTGDAT